MVTPELLRVISSLEDYHNKPLSKAARVYYGENLSSYPLGLVKLAIDRWRHQNSPSQRLPSLGQLQAVMDEARAVEWQRQQGQRARDTVLVRPESNPEVRVMLRELIENLGRHTPGDELPEGELTELREKARREGWRRVIHRNVGVLTDEELKENLCEIQAALAEWERCEGRWCPRSCDGFLPKLARAHDGTITTTTSRCRAWDKRERGPDHA